MALSMSAVSLHASSPSYAVPNRPCNRHPIYSKPSKTQHDVHMPRATHNENAKSSAAPPFHEARNAGRRGHVSAPTGTRDSPPEPLGTPALQGARGPWNKGNSNLEGRRMAQESPERLRRQPPRTPTAERGLRRPSAAARRPADAGPTRSVRRDRRAHRKIL